MKIKVLIIAILLASILTQALLWNHSIIASLVLLALAIIKYKIVRFPKEIIVWLVIVIAGALTEILFVNFIEAWLYIKRDLYGIPYYIPFFWGAIGTSLMSFAIELQKKH